MRVFSIKKSKLIPARSVDIALERDIQKLTEANLENVFGLRFVRSQFPLRNFLADTLAFDTERSAFVIIEYKRDKSTSVIDQGYTYLGLLLDNKGEAVLDYNERVKEDLKRQDVDWSQSRLLFLAQSFTKYQRGALNYRDPWGRPLSIELWEVKVFDNDTIVYNQLLAPELTEPIKTASKTRSIKARSIEQVGRELQVYTLQDHLDTASEIAKQLFVILRDRVFLLGDDIEERPQKLYVAFRTQRNFVEIEFQKQRLKLHLDIPKEELDDPKNVSRDMKSTGHYGTGETELVLEDPEDTNYVLTLIEQAYRRSKR
jgi:predicted transport protein